MTTSLRARTRGLVASLLLSAAWLPACGEAGDEAASVERTASPLVITTCTGAAIAAAVQAGGDVTLNCGSTPIFVTMPSTTTQVTVGTRLHPVVPGSITLSSITPMFDVAAGVTFEVDDLKFAGASSQSMAIHVSGSNALVVRSSFTAYSGFALLADVNAFLSVTGSSFTWNGSTSTNFAAPIYSEGGRVTITDSTFANNRSSSGGSGGAITAFGGTLSISNSTFASNAAGVGGALYVSNSNPTVTNSTFSANTAASAGGAVFVSLGTSTFQNCTFSNNASPLGTFWGTASLTNSVLVDSASPAGVACALGGTGNVQWPTTTTRCGAGFRFGNPVLGALASNGGPTQTMALGAGSAAIDTAIGACPAQDQRHVARPRDGDGNGSFLCDVGAFER